MNLGHMSFLSLLDDAAGDPPLALVGGALPPDAGGGAVADYTLFVGTPPPPVLIFFRLPRQYRLCLLVPCLMTALKAACATLPSAASSARYTWAFLLHTHRRLRPRLHRRFHLKLPAENPRLRRHLHMTETSHLLGPAVAPVPAALLTGKAAAAFQAS